MYCEVQNRTNRRTEAEMLTLKEINSWEELVSFLQGLPEVDLACRGQEKRYDLMKSKIDRCLDALKLEDRLRIERAVCQRFREHAPIHLSAVERRYLQTRWIQLVVMQHYGAPTRLLDWSKSAWVAALLCRVRCLGLRWICVHFPSLSV
jgi:hypothetical protein